MSQLNKPYIVAFDIGKKNFAFVVEEIINKDIFESLPKINKKDSLGKSETLKKVEKDTDKDDKLNSWGILRSLL